MLIDSTVVEKTLQAFAEAGIKAVYTPQQAYADFMAYGDGYREGEIIVLAELYFCERLNKLY
jgi:hypothetical protein